MRQFTADPDQRSGGAVPAGRGGHHQKEADMTTLGSLHTGRVDRPVTDDERRDQWRRKVGTLPPHGTKDPTLQLVD
jgi:hypothetical protein